MILVRKSTGESIALENGFIWVDEFSWKPIEQKLERAIDGTAIIQEGKKKSGRSISLQPSDSNSGWIQRDDLAKISEWSWLQEVFTLKFEYPHDKREFNVIFNHEEGAIDASPVKGIPSVSSDDYYSLSMKYLELKDGN